MRATGVRRGRCLVVTVCVGWLGIAAPAWAMPAVLSKPGPAVDLRPSSGLIGPGRLELLVLNLQAYVEKRQPPFKELLSNTTILPVGEAATEVAAFDDPVSPARRRLLAARLLAAARDEPEAVAAVRTLIGSDTTDNVLTALQPVARRAEADPGADSSPEQTEAVVHTAMKSVMGPLQLKACSSWDGVHHIHWSGGLNVSLSVFVNAEGQKIKEAAKGIDPQSWKDCAPTLWKASYLAQMNGPNPELDANKDPVPAPPKPLGTAYTGTLYEHFVCGPGEPCSTKMLLDVATVLPSAGPDYFLNYQHPRQLGGSPSVVTDYGWIAAWKQSANSVKAQGAKTLGFTDTATAATVYDVLEAVNTMKLHFAELICCKE